MLYFKYLVQLRNTIAAKNTMWWRVRIGQEFQVWVTGLRSGTQASTGKRARETPSVLWTHHVTIFTHIRNPIRAKIWIYKCHNYSQPWHFPEIVAMWYRIFVRYT